MAAMKREKQYDMFDVATGACTLDDYLFQRYSENDLSSNFWIDKKDEVDELRPPKPQADGQPGSEPEIIPVQGPRAEAAKRAAGLAVEGPPPVPVGLEPERPTMGPAVSVTPLESSTPVQTVADGSDRLASQAPSNEAPSLESFQSRPSLPMAEETYQARAVETPPLLDGSDAMEYSVEMVEPGVSAKSPSMEDLLARFHQAAKEYNERALSPEEIEAQEVSDLVAEPPNEGS